MYLFKHFPPFALKGHFVLSLLPYLKLARLHRPHGIWLLLLPCFWGLALTQIPPLSLLILFFAGAVLMRSAGCVYNDIVDRDFDKHVERTASRPLAKGEIPLGKAWVFFFLLMSAGALILFQLPSPAISLGFFSLFLVFLYPWMKRFTYWPQIFLGITYNIGVLLGGVSLSSSLSFPLFLFYAGGILWTLGYDTIYALQDKEDDILVGIKSSALIVAPFIKLFLSFTYGGALVFWGTGGFLLKATGPFWVLLSLCALNFTWQIVSLKKDDPPNCLERFKANSFVGLLLFLGLVFSHMIL